MLFDAASVQCRSCLSPAPLPVESARNLVIDSYCTTAAIALMPGRSEAGVAEFTGTGFWRATIMIHHPRATELAGVAKMRERALAS
jgi:hypothetical protein